MVHVDARKGYYWRSSKLSKLPALQGWLSVPFNNVTCVDVPIVVLYFYKIVRFFIADVGLGPIRALPPNPLLLGSLFRPCSYVSTQSRLPRLVALSRVPSIDNSRPCNKVMPVGIATITIVTTRNLDDGYAMHGRYLVNFNTSCWSLPVRDNYWSYSVTWICLNRLFEMDFYVFYGDPYVASLTDVNLCSVVLLSKQ